MRLFYLVLLNCLIFYGLTSAQSPQSLQYEVELGGLAATTDQLPFWLRANRFGTVPLKGPLATLQAGVSLPYHRTNDSTATHRNRFDWGFGVYGVANAGPRTQVLLPEAYVKARYGWLELLAGRRRDVIGLGDSTLSSGFVVGSGNALPMPLLRLGTPGFVPLGWFRQFFAFHVGYTHAWFNVPYMQGAYLHQKYVYARFGRPGAKIRVYAGINHQVQWGGRADYLVGTPYAVDGKLTTAFPDYLDLVIGVIPKDLENDRFTNFDGYNRIGNHIGSYDLGLEWNSAEASWMLYHQHLYEDASGLVLANVPDGLTGLRYRSRQPALGQGFQVRGLVLEWLTTMNQSGPSFDQATTRFKGSDDYYNHVQYREGWSYYGPTIGTPFIAPLKELQPANPSINKDWFFPNNRLQAWYAGMEATLNGISLTGRVSYSRNHGTYSYPFTPIRSQFSALIGAQFPISRWRNTFLNGSLALDQGTLYPKSLGGRLSLRKVW